jgi:hypothetical protein
MFSEAGFGNRFCLRQALRREAGDAYGPPANRKQKLVVLPDKKLLWALVVRIRRNRMPSDEDWVKIE